VYFKLLFPLVLAQLVESMNLNNRLLAQLVESNRSHAEAPHPQEATSCSSVTHTGGKLKLSRSCRINLTKIIHLGYQSSPSSEHRKAASNDGSPDSTGSANRVSFTQDTKVNDGAMSIGFVAATAPASPPPPPVVPPLPVVLLFDDTDSGDRTAFSFSDDTTVNNQRK
jgi:hypothetical protein